MSDQIQLFDKQHPARKHHPMDYTAKEFKIVCLRECVSTEGALDTPEKAADYWNNNIVSHPFFNPEAECVVVILLNSKLRVKGHVFVSVGTLDTCLIHPREVFRPAVVAAASQVILMHNHPSGDSSPSAPDITVTRELMRAGQILKIEVKDHVIAGRKSPENPRGYHSLKEQGHLY